MKRKVIIEIEGNKPDLELEGRFTAGEILQLAEWLKQLILLQEIVLSKEGGKDDSSEQKRN